MQGWLGEGREQGLRLVDGAFVLLEGSVDGRQGQKELPSFVPQLERVFVVV